MFKLSEEVISALKIMWNYMVLDMDVPKSELIIGCGCKNLDIPKKCASLLNERIW